MVFDPGYAATLPFGDVVDYARLMRVVPLDSIVGGANALDVLRGAFDEGGALAQLAYTHAVRHAFQYMLNPVHELVRFDQLAALTAEDDALTMTLKAALRNLCGRGLLPAGRCRPAAPPADARRGME